MFKFALFAALVACSLAVPAKKLIGGAPRIVGGDEARPHSHPWQASLQRRNSHICGASIINDRWLVTAAHCVEGATKSQMSVAIAEHDLDVDSTEIDYSLDTIIMHPNYRSSSAGFPNDIALLRTSRTMDLDSEAAAIALPAKGTDFLGNTDCFITGWGLTQGTQDRTVLQEIPADIRSQSECERAWGRTYINSGHICVNNGNTGACNGDSGGPLACYTGGRWMLAGATSWGISGCTTRGYPSVYTRVSQFTQWIETTMARY